MASDATATATTPRRKCTGRRRSELLFALLLGAASLVHSPSSAFTPPPTHPKRKAAFASRRDRREFPMLLHYDLYGIPNSCWTSPEWNWGYASGTGHDCAAICRTKFADRPARAALVESLLTPTPDPAAAGRDPPFEEVKLVLALAWQRGRWDGTDGGPGGYGAVLSAMAEARRYEVEGTEESRARTLVEDMRARFSLLRPTEAEADEMAAIVVDEDVRGDELDCARRRCTGLVLRAMGFVENGL